MKINTILAHNSNYGGVRSLSNIRYIVVHFTANDGDTDTNNANYFKSTPNLKTSSHYFVDDDSITQSVPDTYIAYHCGGTKYYHATCRNANSLGVEMCDTIKNGKHDLSAKTRENTVELIRDLMKKYNIPIGNVVRHYDVTHKNCPAYFVKDTKAWQAFKDEIKGGATMSKPKANITPKSPKADIKWLQKKLNKAVPSHKISEDGIYGFGTRIAVLNYWKNTGANQANATGYTVGQGTINALSKL